MGAAKRPQEWDGISHPAFFDLKYEAMQGSGAFIHIVNEKLRGVDRKSVLEKPFSEVGTLQPIQTIELDEDDLNHLTRYRVD